MKQMTLGLISSHETLMSAEEFVLCINSTHKVFQERSDLSGFETILKKYIPCKTQMMLDIEDVNYRVTPNEVKISSYTHLLIENDIHRHLSAEEFIRYCTGGIDYDPTVTNVYDVFNWVCIFTKEESGMIKLVVKIVTERNPVNFFTVVPWILGYFPELEKRK